MARKRTMHGRCKYTGRWPGSRTDCDFSMDLPAGYIAITAAPLVNSFRKVMAAQWPDATQRPALKKIVITIHFPTP